MTEDMCDTLARHHPHHCTPLHRAIEYRNEAALQTMLDAGANREFGNRDGTTPLQYAVLFGSEAMVKALLPRKALRHYDLQGDCSEQDLVTMAVQSRIDSDYVPEWVWQKNHPRRPLHMFQQRAANVDLILAGTRGQWTPADLVRWLQAAPEPYVCEVLEVVHGHLRFTDLRRAWILAVVCSSW
jgi:hypothetical protein